MRLNIPLREAQRRFDARQSFSCNGTLVGHRGAPASTGWLTNEWVRYIRQFGRHIVYTAMSYHTPVAWVMVDGRVIVPPIKHSPTTQRHMRSLGVPFSEPVVDTGEEVAA